MVKNSAFRFSNDSAFRIRPNGSVRFRILKNIHSSQACNVSFFDSMCILYNDDIMECYATHLSLWRAAIYCGTLWVPLPLSRPFSLSFLLFCTRFGLACLFGWMFDSTRRSRGMAIRPTNKGKLNQRGCNLIRKREKKRAGRGEGEPQCATIYCCHEQRLKWVAYYFTKKYIGK